MVHCVEYTGVPLKFLLDEAGLKPNAKWILAEGADAAAMTRSIPLAKALGDCLVAYRMNGEMLRPENGYPLRLVVPGWEGNMWVKWLRRLKVGDEPWFTREETSKYTDLLENGKARQFTFVMDAKSVITAPSPQAPVSGNGFMLISGLAWSGRGKIARVDVSLDGGNHWSQADLLDDLGRWAWRHWRITVDLAPGEHEILVRAWDSSAATQPEHEAALWNPKGYVNNARPRVRVRVTS
jgi:sulfane dehydrogenase subunit SoxC